MKTDGVENVFDARDIPLMTESRAEVHRRMSGNTARIDR